MRDHHEVERAYAVGPDDVLPPLDALPGVAGVSTPQEAVLVATYVDTDDLALLRAGVTLRRRRGGADAGWHLKVPAGAGRDEVHRPLGSSERVPPTLARLVTGWTRGRALHPVAVIETRRTTHLLLDGEHRSLAEVADDVVVGTPSDGGPVSAWREVEIELVEAGPDLLVAADAFLGEHGIRPSTEQRKIGTVLAHRAPEVDRPGRAGRRRAASRALQHRLGGLVADLSRADADVRRDVPDGVHQLRVTSRRLRGALATYAPLLDSAVTEPLRGELRWLARTLGEGRDAEVLHELLRGRVSELPRSQVVGPVRRRVDRSYAARRRAAAGHARTVLTSRRYLRLLTRLAALVQAPPWTVVAEQPAADVLPALVARDWRRVRRRVALLAALDAAGERADDAARDEALHDVRKAAKRLRYACEALEPWWGDEAKGLRRAAQEITQVLGDRQDASVARTHLRRVAREATAAGESAFTYGVLHAREEARGERLEEEFAAVWERVADPSLRTWLG